MREGSAIQRVYHVLSESSFFIFNMKNRKIDKKRDSPMKEVGITEFNITNNTNGS